MNIFPQHLLSEDRLKFERLLDETLASAPRRPELAAIGQRLNAEQLRSMAFNATGLITAAAADEYQRYVLLREEFRARPSGQATASGVRRDPSPPLIPSAHQRPDRPGADISPRPPESLGRRLSAAFLGARQPGGQKISDGVPQQRWSRMSYSRRLLATLLGLHVRPQLPVTVDDLGAAPAAGRPATDAIPVRVDRTGNGVWDNAMISAVAVLAPLLSGTASVIFLVVGYILKMLDPEPAISQTLLTAGWLFAGAAAVALAASGAGLLVAALRNGPSSSSDSCEEHGEVAQARDAWLDALLQRGILPFLGEALSEQSTEVMQAPGVRTTPRMPRLGYSRPDFDPDGGSTSGPRPRLSSPDFSSPDFGGPDHPAE